MQTELPRKLQPPDERLCSVCKGMRFLQFAVPYGSDLFNQITPCPACSGLGGEVKDWAGKREIAVQEY